jgi:alpha-ketoglutarate-dependent taurine dioxygenase
VAISNQKPDGTVLKEDEHRYKSLRGNEGWHTDSSYMPLAAKASVLSAQVMPSADGETEWAGHLGQPLRAAPGAALRPTRATGDAAHARRGGSGHRAGADRSRRAGRCQGAVDLEPIDRDKRSSSVCYGGPRASPDVPNEEESSA